MRDELMMDLVDRALGDAEFRAKARQDLEGTLKASGFDLTEEELAAVKEFHSRTDGLDDSELETAIRTRQFGG